jgi:hypothetical protein
MSNEVLTENYEKNLFIILKKNYTTLEVIADYKNLDIDKKIKDFDIRAKIEEIEALLIDINNDSVMMNKVSIKKSINSLHEVIVNIYKTLDTISVKILEHQNKWFYYWRIVDFTAEFKELELIDKLMAVRYNRVKDLMKINWNTSAKN